MVTNKRLILIATICTWATCSSGASVYLEEVRAPGGYESYRVKSVSVQPGEFRLISHSSGATYAQTILVGGGSVGSYTCQEGRGGSPYCLDGWVPPNITCETSYDAAKAAAHFVGHGWTIPKRGGAVDGWYAVCPTANGMIWSMLVGTVVVKPASASCTATTADIRMQGRVGEKLTDSDIVEIQCDSEASLKLSIPNGGIVKVGGEGEVQLKFPASGKDVLNVAGTTPNVRIDGVLTKSPTTAGTYKGSTVLLLDVL